MTWPTGSVITTDVDASTDSPANARDDILSAIQNLNEIVANGEPVLLGGTQTIAGTKTFSSNPIVPTPSSGGHATTKAYVDDLIAAITAALSFPSGAVLPFCTASAPSGWLKCDGSAVSRTTYANLFAAISTLFGAGDGSTTFNLPDLRGEFIRGFDDGRGVDSGRVLGSFQDHQSNNLAQVKMVYGAGGSSEVSVPDNGSYSATLTTGEEGASPNYMIQMRLHGRETRPRNVALLYCIKT